MPPLDLLHFLVSLGESADLSPWKDNLTMPVLQIWKAEAEKYALKGDAPQALAVVKCLLQVGYWLKAETILALGHWTGGNVNYLLADYPKAINHYHKAHSFYASQGDTLNLARSQVGLVGALSSLKQYAEAQKVGANSWNVLSASDEPEDKKRLAGLANNLGIAADYLGRYEESLEFYQTKLTYWQNQPVTHRAISEIGRTRLNMGVVKQRLNLWAEAEMDFQTGRQLLRQLPDSERPQSDMVRGAIHLANLLAKRGGLPQEVLSAFAQARDERATLATPPNDLPDLLHLDVSEAEWQIKARHINRDMGEHLENLLRRAIQTGQGREANRIELLLAVYAALEGEIETAVSRYTRLCHSLQEEDLLCRAWHGLGQMYYRMGDINKAQQAWETGIDSIETNRRSLSVSYFRSGFLHDKLVIYQDLIALHIAQSASESAFQWAERARARELVEWLGNRLEMPTEMTLTIPTVCAAIPLDTLFLVYMLIEEQYWVFPLTHHRLYPPRMLGSLPAAYVVEQTLSQLYQLGQFPVQFVQRRATTLLETGQSILEGWYKQFLQPVNELLQSHSKVVIAPDGLLYRLPFHAFYDTENGRYLIETHEVQYTASATAWFLSQYRNQLTSQKGVVLGFDGTQLHHTTTEVEAITHVFPHFAAYTGKTAVYERLEEAQTADFIHIAAHALFRADHPLFSNIELANGRLEAQNVLQLQLQARLVCLSACETGRGLLRGGEYLGLAHTFLLAGAGNVLATHWAIDDAATAQFMGIFYQNLSQGMPLATALCAAQRAILISEQQHLHLPYYWAAFFLFGGIH